MHLMRRLRYSRLVRKLQANKFVSFTASSDALFDGQTIKVVFGATAVVKDVLIRVWGKDRMIFVRAKADSSFPPGALSAVARIPNARFVFLDGHQMRSVVAKRPALERRVRLILKSPLGLMADYQALLAFRVQKFTGETDDELIEEPPSLADITLWFGYPVRNMTGLDERVDKIIYLDVTCATPPDWTHTKPLIELRFPGVPIQRIEHFFAIDSGEATRAFLDTVSLSSCITITHDAPTAAYLHHCGYRAAVIKTDGQLTIPSSFTAEGMAMLKQFSATGLHDLKMRRAISLADFVSHEAGEFRQHRILLREINRAIGNAEDKLTLLAVSKAREHDSSLAVDLQLLFERLALKSKGTSVRSFAVIQRLMSRLHQSGFISDNAGDLAPPYLQHLEVEHGQTAIALPPNAPVRHWRTRLREVLAQASVRWFFRLGRTGLLAPLSRVAARQIAQLGIERGFQFIVGMTSDRAAAIALARKIEHASPKSDTHSSIICARLYLSAGATDDGLRVLRDCRSFEDAQQGIIISCLHTTGHVGEALEWYRQLSDEVKYRPHVCVHVTRLLLLTSSRSDALAYLQKCHDRNPHLSPSAQAVFAGLYVLAGEFDQAHVHLTELVERGSNNAEVLLKWAQAMRMTGGSKAGIRYLQHPQFVRSTRALLLLSYLLAEEGDLMGALKAAFAGFEIDEASTVLVARLTLLASAASADDLIGDVLSRHAATSATAKINAANHMISRQRYAEVARLLDYAEASKADRLRIAQVRLRLYQHTENYGSAKTELERALAIDPSRLNFVLAAAELALKLAAKADAENYAARASLISAKDHRVLELHARLAEHKKQYKKAQEYVGKACKERRANSLRDDLRSNWHHFRLCAAAGQVSDAHAAFRRLVSGLHQLLPSEVSPWNGMALKGQRVLLLPRGGPGDELRTLQVVGRHLSQEGATIGFLGDARMRNTFVQNFPEGEFIENPIAGSKLRADQISQINLPRLQAGSVEMARRLGIYIRANTIERFDQVLFADDVVLHKVLPNILSGVKPQYARLDLTPDAQSRAEEVLAGLEGEGPLVTISWRGSYFSPNRPSDAFLQIAELGPILRNRGVRFLDTHPNSSDAERSEIEERYGVRILRPKKENFRDDLALLGAIMCKADANIVPPVTQRDLAAAVGAPNIWSFDVIPGISEAWRVDKKTQSDLWQPNILHHTERHYGHRSEVVAALAAKVATLR
ncbi:hypothetical protein SLH49_15735 [Cognatiyoonia sp. IB215446]|uniref:tetratricopeptide repeat protein n=1 Tax=Cognatiyoonia sp. IB215446 TaxID=3097355 RepID=UPI002A184A77|nr:hypothetical protein [Cognatiyoonia sp. IB215446]MDX8349438.1 hypothetical protein [Cognatiyoonia sp. IB215446]